MLILKNTNKFDFNEALEEKNVEGKTPLGIFNELMTRKIDKYESKIASQIKEVESVN